MNRTLKIVLWMAAVPFIATVGTNSSHSLYLGLLGPKISLSWRFQDVLGCTGWTLSGVMGFIPD